MSQRWLLAGWPLCQLHCPAGYSPLGPGSPPVVQGSHLSATGHSYRFPNPLWLP